MINLEQKQGFALLLTLIVVSVVIALGLSLVEITLRQLNLSGVTRDSEIAFHAAYLGSECAEYSVREVRKTDVNGFVKDENWNAMSDRCVGDSEATQEFESYTSLDADSGGGSGDEIYHNNYRFTWGPTSEKRCTEVDIISLDARTAGDDITFDFADYNQIGYYKNKSCKDGRLCTVIFSQGYNRACDDIGTQRTLQREVVIEF